MKILVTGAKGFVGKNLCAQLNNIKEGKAKNYGFATKEEAKSQQLSANCYIEDIFQYDIDSTPEQLDTYCKNCDFVFNLAGVNRPQNQEEFMQGNFGFASTLLNTLKKHKNNCPVMISSSIQATLAGRFGTSEYGKSKKAGEELMFEYGKETGAKVLVYRFPNLFGKWCRPNYNSAVATFCNNIANDLPITVSDNSVELELLYIDDLIDEMFRALKGQENRCEYDGLTPVSSESGRYCFVPKTHRATLGRIVE
jgi:UDP-2-acetamido-2,6-beta-L-arabino-hexul-4-ose reductase